MIVKSGNKEAHIQDLRETFKTLRAYHLRLNPAKCTFGVTCGKFLGHMISGQGIKVNPEKTGAILEMPPPSTPDRFSLLTVV